MNVNELIVQGAEPLFLLDYYACGKLKCWCCQEYIIEGIVYGCHESGCALIGGDTSEMPGIYKDGDFLTYMPLYLFIYLYIMQMHNYFF